jgi:hypothetical protein
MTEPSVIRAKLKQHLGDERYAKFVKALSWPPGRQRLRFWHEPEWERFVIEHPDCRLEVHEIIAVCADCPEHGANTKRAAYLVIVGTWLTDKTTEGQVVKKQAKEWVSGSWEKFKNKVEVGDELYEYCSPPETWDQLRGQAGIALVRDGKVIDEVVTVLN